MQIKPLLITAFESALNRYLNLDEQLATLLAPLAGKVIAMHITPFSENLYFCPTSDSVQILDNYLGEVDTQLTGSLAALGLMGVSNNPMRFLFKGQIQIDGDANVARHFQNLFAKLDINLEAKIAAIAGEQFAEKLSLAFRNSRDWSADSLHSLRLNLEEYLQEETRELPAKPEAEQFFQRVDELRSDYDRLFARVQQLESALLQSVNANQNTHKD